MVTKPKRLVAQATPIPRYLLGGGLSVNAHRTRWMEERSLERGEGSTHIWTVNNGNTAPMTYLNRPLAAAALAPANGPYVSMRYKTQEQKTRRFPMPNGIVARMGKIQ